jgi:hypothetical protein
MKTQLDISGVQEVYQTQLNYEILDCDPNSKLCAIYFSSHAIYFPNTDEAFEEMLVKPNRFEWKRNILKKARKCIFIRDVQKQWYLEGINSSLNSIEKLLEFLKHETAGLEVICIGNSAGGYAATLFGCLLNAKYIFNFCGQFYLDCFLNEQDRASNPILEKYENTEISHNYYDLQEVIQSSDVPILFLFPKYSVQDVKQAAHVSSIKNIYKLEFKTETHGQTCFPINFLDLFSTEFSKITSLTEKFKGEVISPTQFSLYISGYLKTITFLSSRYLREFKANLKNFLGFIKR